MSTLTSLPADLANAPARCNTRDTSRIFDGDSGVLLQWQHPLCSILARKSMQNILCTVFKRASCTPPIDIAVPSSQRERMKGALARRLHGMTSPPASMDPPFVSPTLPGKCLLRCRLTSSPPSRSMKSTSVDNFTRSPTWASRLLCYSSLSNCAGRPTHGRFVLSWTKRRTRDSETMPRLAECMRA